MRRRIQHSSKWLGRPPRQPPPARLWNDALVLHDDLDVVAREAVGTCSALVLRHRMITRLLGAPPNSALPNAMGCPIEMFETRRQRRDEGPSG